MEGVHSTLRKRQSESPSLAPGVDRPAVDLSAAATTKEESFTATPLSTTSITPILTMDLDFNADPDVKLQDDTLPSPSQSPTLVADVSGQNCKMSPSPTPPPPVMTDDGSTSKSSTPPLAIPGRGARKVAPAPVQLIGDLPVAREAALKEFTEISDNNYQYKSLGRSREVFESMTCDCSYKHGVDKPDVACGPSSDCINRLTQVECLPDDCRCETYCQNQRFQRKEYANIDIVLTEKKGYGLRAEGDLPKDAFIYEYVGDVVNPISFKKRMREYAEEGIRHFYFMMLQKDEFIDATKSGGIGRFANHSCNPNCYVAKWTVGEHVRMGIFAKRNIKVHEELTFNYNVDRYGHQAQECFCGEPMCVGYIGGKTQTDIAAMDDLTLDALGITDEDDLMELKGTKKKKGKKIDDPDFMPTLKAILQKEVPKVVQAIRQSSSKKVLSKLLTRIKITEDQTALREIMRLRGYSLMTNVLEDWASDNELVTLCLECMQTWPLQNRNKVQDSKVHVPVEACAALEDEKIKSLAQKLLGHWESLPVYNRIPKRTFKREELELETLTIAPVAYIVPADPRTKLRPRSPPPTPRPQKKPRHSEPYPASGSGGSRMLLLPPDQMRALEAARRKRAEEERISKQSIKDIIASAAEAAAAEEAAVAAAAAEAKAKAEVAAEKAARRKERALKKATMTPEEKEKNKEKRLLKLVGEVVVKCMSKHSKTFDRDSFKKHARELTQIITDKEKKSSGYREGRLEALSEEKVGKIKKFAKEYIAKILRKMEKSGKGHHHHHHHRPPGSSASATASTSTSTPSAMDNTPSTSMHTPNSNDGEDAHIHDASMSMSVEEAMGMDSDSGNDDDLEGGGEAEADRDEDMAGQEVPDPPSVSVSMPPPPSPPRWKDAVKDEAPNQDPHAMHTDDVLIVTALYHPDPRLRAVPDS
ncbi:unnamed protein product [Cyclocybe aegerita]|uniref:Histone-lysine N-methyltransferase, H3 lysine-36 specific n=1 Tax=Cyclocybe aegerita TaxID=1973307 RepID=A0A8S0XGX1_CYCAE|nr:unnamed protein product [Cyclocybe aegerita]